MRRRTNSAARMRVCTLRRRLEIECRKKLGVPWKCTLCGKFIKRPAPGETRCAGCIGRVP